MSDDGKPGTICEAVQQWADKDPDAPAFIAEGRSPLTYGALAELLAEFGRTLNASGYGRGDRIGVVHTGGAAMASTILGVAGHSTAVPLTAAYTVGEFAIHLHDRSVNALIIQAGMDTPARDAARKQGLPVLEVAPMDDVVAGSVMLRPGPEQTPRHSGTVGPDDLMLIMATSGTTSQSKIVPLRHRHIMLRSVTTMNFMGLRTDDRCINLQPLTYAGGLYNLFASLLSGGSVVFLPQFDVATFYRYLESLGPTWYTGSYTFQHSIHSQAPAFEHAIRKSRLRFIRTSSGALASQIADSMEELFGVPVIEAYSTTETGRIAGNPLPPGKRKRGTVGRPLIEDVAILGTNGEFLPPLARGEIIVRGAQMFDGYENNPAANKSAFVDGWYRTGDEGYFDEDGYLTLAGRIKEFINRGGEKIAPIEIDDALLRHPDVSEAIAFPIPHPTLGSEVGVAVVLEEGAAVTDQDLARFLRRRLAHFKLPRRFLFVDSIPKSAATKIQRGQLAKTFDLDGAFKATAKTRKEIRSATPLEAQLKRLWAESLGLERVGLHDNFFLLGGDSLQAVDLFLAIEAQIGHRLPRAVLFEAGTVAEMAARIEDNRAAACIVPIQPKGDKPPFFCVHDADGHVLNLRLLARHLGEDQPFFGVQCVGLDRKEMPFTRIEDMAEHYIREIRKVEPQGPYYIGGYSFGGRVAYVMAQQLRAAGLEVGLLALLDTYSHLGQRRISGLQGLAQHGKRMAKLPLGAMPGYVALRVRTFIGMAYMALQLKLFSAAFHFCQSIDRPMPRILRSAEAANYMIRKDYRPEPFDGDAVLFKAELYARSHPDSHEGWRWLIRGRLEIRPIPGRHFEILQEPHVRVLAHELAECLAEKQSRHSQNTTNPETVP